MKNSAIVSVLLSVVCASGCGAESLMQMAGDPAVIGAGAAILGTAVTIHQAEAQTAESRTQTEIVRRTESVRMMTPADRQIFDQLEGSWKFTDPLSNAEMCYIFQYDGVLFQKDVVTGNLTGTGSYVVDDARVLIHWSDGELEVARRSGSDASEFNYEIVNHSDTRQIGMSMTFRR